MGVGQFMAKEFIKEIGNRSREFYEFVMPPVDV
jgi:HSP20 family protein